MSEITFEWNSRKASENKRKHGVSFEEAKSAFLDENARLIPDPENSDDEDRFILLGLSIQLRVLLVCHCYRADDNVIRIISARKAARSERMQYAEYLP
ncbi:MAG: BrnT family toxin [Gammaproteobacteria bacterium]|nr:BrnT family toxin [Gammaproteobacteria bacterium]MDH5304966.1 BrnT family toxin [Gammaproteobacteria bacterium]MDH5322008.1 BrnT family toxin [Gammaproteobacteria bacterium]